MGHVIVSDLSDQGVKKLVVVGPVAVATGHSNLRGAIGAPDVCHQALEPTAMATCSLIITHCRVESILHALI